MPELYKTPLCQEKNRFAWKTGLFHVNKFGKNSINRFSDRGFRTHLTEVSCRASPCHQAGDGVLLSLILLLTGPDW